MRHPSEIRACIEGIRFHGFEGFLITPIEFSLFGFFQRFNQSQVDTIQLAWTSELDGRLVEVITKSMTSQVTPVFAYFL